MAVAIHVGKTGEIDYNFKDFDKGKWNCFRAWKVLSERLKWSQIFAKNAKARDDVTNEKEDIRNSEDGQNGSNNLASGSGECNPPSTSSGMENISRGKNGTR